jgi:O-antigen ligase
MITNILHKDHIWRRVFLTTVTCLLVAYFFGPGGRVWETFFLLILILLSTRGGRKTYSEFSTSDKMFLWGLTAFAGVNILAIVLAPDLLGMDVSHWDDEYFYGVVLALSLGLGSRRLGIARELLVIFMVISALYVIREIVCLNPSAFTIPEGRLSGLDGLYPNRLAMILLFMAASFLAGLQMMRSRITILACLTIFFLTVYLLVLTDSRFALLTFGLVTVPTAIFFQRRWGSFKQRVVVACLIFFLLAPLGGWLWYMGATPERRSTRNAYNRLEGWKAAVYFISEGPWYRAVIGYGDFKKTFLILADHYNFDAASYDLVHTHNVPLQIFMETGLFGVIFMVLPWWVVFSIMIRTWTSASEKDSIVAGCLISIFLTVLISSQMDLTLAKEPGRLIYYLLGTAFALGKPRHKDKGNPLLPEEGRCDVRL